MTHSLLTLDTLDDRRELWHLLHGLSPWSRVAFLERWCLRVPPPTPAPSVVRMRERIEAARRGCDNADRQLTNEIYYDLLSLATNYGIDLGAVAVDLEAVRRDRARLSLSAWLRKFSAPPSHSATASAHTSCSR